MTSRQEKSQIEDGLDRHVIGRPFPAARRPQHDPDDQAEIPHPRLGFYGVIDERLDIALVEQVARMRPDW